ncbi:MAG: hypothetical protein WBB28_14600 [Crinalium sp.]|uniref:Uncharacterized protein n=1 Tax=Crinalium epipsammum PCC 9333 TaxID=1173022 RepID=K9VTS9_9CYAN|nr:hypothetical protein [Crinalium epipsammum]AFZ11483.1 hypothetical protein Cri9333_0527 [Crinalium epipsammum PCC 9333]
MRGITSTFGEDYLERLKVIAQKEDKVNNCPYWIQDILSSCKREDLISYHPEIPDELLLGQDALMLLDQIAQGEKYRFRDLAFKLSDLNK